MPGRRSFLLLAAGFPLLLEALSILEAKFPSYRYVMEEFDIRAAGYDSPMDSLSGGSMQKVVLAREFSADPALLIAAQPTRGVDIGASEFIHNQLIAKRDDGKAILLVSADLSEVMNLSDRIAVMYKGKITGVFQNSPDLTEEELGLYMLGIKEQTPEEMAQNM